MGRKNRKLKATSKPEIEVGMSKNIRRETSETCNILLEKCSRGFGQQSLGDEWKDFTEIHDLVSKLRQLQKGLLLNQEKREKHFPAFISWLQENGVNTSSVAIEKFPIGGYGLKASRNIDDNELFLVIPHKVILSTETAQESPLGRLIAEDRILQAMPNIVLALHVLCETADGSSFWTPYLRILPQSYTTPLYFTKADLELLRGSPALSEILNQFRNITRQYSYFFKLFQGTEIAGTLPPVLRDFCFDDYLWAVSTVMTRQNQIPSKDGHHMINALIPMWDMCNHTNGHITTGYNVEKNQSECFSLGPQREGEQVFIFYGERSNTDFLVHSGFIYPNNLHDRVALKMGISKNDVLYGMKTEVLARLSLLSSRVFSLHCSSEPVDSDTLSYLRVFSMSKDELEVVLNDRSKLSSLRDFGEVFSADNEVKAWSFLATRSQLLLKAYPTTDKEDEALLSGKSLGEHARMCVQLRLCEKRILQHTVEYATAQKEHALLAQSETSVTTPLAIEESAPSDTGIQIEELPKESLGSEVVKLSKDNLEVKIEDLSSSGNEVAMVTNDAEVNDNRDSLDREVSQIQLQVNDG